MSRLDWAAIVAQAVAIVNSYNTGVTLLQLVYRLVAALVLPNTQTAYKTVRSRTAAARREGRFLHPIDRNRAIHRYRTFGSLAEAHAWLGQTYCRERAEGQLVSLYLGVEKNGIVEQLESWFGDLSTPILALGGYSSQTYVDEIPADTRHSGGPRS